MNGFDWILLLCSRSDKVLFFSYYSQSKTLNVMTGESIQGEHDIWLIKINKDGNLATIYDENLYNKLTEKLKEM